MGGRRVRAGGRVRAGVLDGLELTPEVLVPRGGCRHEHDPADVLPGRGRSRESSPMSNLTRSMTSSRSCPWPSRRGSWRTGAEHGEKARVSTMTLEAVLNRAGQMNRAERWKLWTACGQHQLDSLPRTETGGAKRPRYCPRCWTAFSADGVLWNPPCLPDERGL
jgi:hypothetical protein